MRCFIVASEQDDIRFALAGVLQRLGYSGEVSQSLAGLQGDPAFLHAANSLVLVAASGAGDAGVSEAVEFARAAGGRAFLVLVAETIAPEDYKRLVRTGSADWMRPAGCETELRDLLARLAAAEAGERAAKMVSFLPSKGGVGNTSLLVEAAVHLSGRRKRTGDRVAILDLNLQGGTVADALDLEPRFDVTEIMTGPERLDEQLVDVFTSRHSERLDVFASPIRPIGLDTVRPEIIFTFVDAIASRYDVILFDLPSIWLPWTDALLRGSDAVVVVGHETVPALRRLSAALGHLDEIGVPEGRVTAVLSQAEVGLLGGGKRRAVVERALPGRRLFFVRRDRAAFEEAANVGRPLLEMVPNARVTRDIGRVADWIGTATDAEPASHPAAPARQGSTA